MKSEIKAQIRLPHVSVEVRDYEWETAETSVHYYPYYTVSRQLSRTRPGQRFCWTLSDGHNQRAASQVSLVPPNLPIKVIANAGRATFLLCVFEPDHFERALGISQWRDGLATNFVSACGPFVQATMDRLADEAVLQETDSDLLAEALTVSLTIELRRIIQRCDQDGRNCGQLANWQLERVREILENPADGHTATVAELAKHCAISSRHLMRGFKASTGTTIHNYAAQLRLDRAKNLLGHADLPLKVIAAKTGFSSAGHFSTDFRRRTGCSPSDYRARIQGRDVAGPGS